MATEVKLGFGAAVIEISPIAYRAALKMDAAEGIGLLYERMRLNDQLKRESAKPKQSEMVDIGTWLKMESASQRVGE